MPGKLYFGTQFDEKQAFKDSDPVSLLEPDTVTGSKIHCINIFKNDSFVETVVSKHGWHICSV